MARRPSTPPPSFLGQSRVASSSSVSSNISEACRADTSRPDLADYTTPLEAQDRGHNRRTEARTGDAALPRGDRAVSVNTGSDGIKDITTPLTEADVQALNAGDRVRIPGVLTTARDAAHG